jgi:hypothetical protein
MKYRLGLPFHYTPKEAVPAGVVCFGALPGSCILMPTLGDGLNGVSPMIEKRSRELLRSLNRYLLMLPPRLRRPLIAYMMAQADRWLDLHAESYRREDLCHEPGNPAAVLGDKHNAA